jgi:hypothetical protein
MSGTPAVAFASPAPLMYTPENPQRSINRAADALNAPGITTQPRVIARRKSVVLLTNLGILSTDYVEGEISSRAHNLSVVVIPSQQNMLPELQPKILPHRKYL